jgi:hypothetical protein
MLTLLSYPELSGINTLTINNIVNGNCWARNVFLNNNTLSYDVILDVDATYNTHESLFSSSDLSYIRTEVPLKDNIINITIAQQIYNEAKKEYGPNDHFRCYINIDERSVSINKIPYDYNYAYTAIFTSIFALLYGLPFIFLIYKILNNIFGCENKKLTSEYNTRIDSQV